MQAPDEELWGKWQDDLDTVNAYRLLHGKTVNELVALFAENPIEVAEGLRFAPCAVSITHLRGCIDYLQSNASKHNADAASSLLNLILHMVRNCPTEVFSPVGSFLQSLRSVSERQSYYDADPVVYGSFSKLVSEIETCLKHKK